MVNPAMALRLLPPSQVLAAADASKDHLARQVLPAMMENPDWTESTVTTENMVVTDKFFVVLFHKSLVSSVHPDPQDPKVSPETKDPVDQKERTETTVKMVTKDLRVWSDRPATKVPLDHLAYPDQKENPDESTKSMAPPVPTDQLDLLAELDPKVFSVLTELPAPLDPKDLLAIKAFPAAKASQAHQDNPANLDLEANQELAITAQRHVPHQDIKPQEHGTHSKTLILGAIFLQETVLLFDNAQFLCFIFFVRWHISR